MDAEPPDPVDGPVSVSDPARGTVPSVAKAVRILDTLAASREPVGLADLSRRLDLPKSTTRTLCTTLVNTRMAIRDTNGTYSLGPHVVDLSRAYLARVNLTADFAEICASMPELADRTLVLAVLDGRDVVYVARRPGAEHLGATYTLGLRLPASCTAVGKALLSRLSSEEITRRFPGPELPTLTERSLTTLDALRADLAEVRRRGYAVEDEESTTGVFSVAAATPPSDGDGVAVAVGVSVSTSRREQVVPEHLVTLARVLSERIGASTSPRGIAGQVRTWGRTAARAGDPVPDLVLAGTSGRTVSLRRLAQDRHLVLFFYPGDLEGLRYPELAGCTTQARAFRDAIASLTERGATVVGVSLQTTPRQREFVAREALPFELLSDEGRELVGALGIPLWLSQAGEEFASRALVVVRRGGEIAAVRDGLSAEEQVGHALAALDEVNVAKAS